MSRSSHNLKIHPNSEFMPKKKDPRQNVAGMKLRSITMSLRGVCTCGIVTSNNLIMISGHFSSIMASRTLYNALKNTCIMFLLRN